MKRMVSKLTRPTWIIALALAVGLMASAVLASAMAAEAQVTGTTYYLSPNGNDAALGTTEGHAWKTFNRAWTDLYPGDTLVLLDGVYTQSLAPNVRDGEPVNPITIRAKNDGKAILEGENVRAPVSLARDYYVIEGIVAQNSSGTVYVITGNNNILRRVSGYNANKDGNSHVFTISTSHDNLLEDCIASGTGRKMIFTWGGNHNTIRRCLARWQHYEMREHCGEWPWGENLEFYNSSNSLMENSIGYGGAPTTNVSVLGNINSANGNTPFSRDNRLLGVIALRPSMFADDTVMEWSTTRPQPACASIVVPYTQWADQRQGVGIITWGGDQPGQLADVTGNVFQDIFVWGGAALGFNQVNHFPDPSMRNTLIRGTILNNGLSGVAADGGVGVDVNLDNFVLDGSSSLTIQDSRIEGTQYQGGGAQLQYRYVDGVLTNQPLWPWPMQDRIMEELGIDITGELTEILRVNGVATGSTIPIPAISPLPPHPITDLHPGPVAVHFLDPVTVTLSTTTPGAVIRYSTDRSKPTSTSPAYAGPITLSSTTLLKAKVFANGQASHTRSAYYRIDAAKTNQAPEVDASILPFLFDYAEIMWPNNEVGLYGLAEDTTFPNPPGRLTTAWTQVSGPGTTTFADAAKPRTRATFSGPGRYVLRLTASDGQLTTRRDVTVQVWPQDLVGIVFPIPGRIDAENYRSGGEGEGYHELHGYGDVQYRNRPVSPVDVEIAWNDGSGYSVTEMVPQEWMAYDIDVKQPGVYTLSARVAGAVGGGVFHVELDGQDISGPMVVPSNGTGGFRAFTTLTASTPSLAAGRHELRIVADQPSSAGAQLHAAINYLEFSNGQAPTFADVPFTHPYYTEVEALYRAGYTAGCAEDPLRYCPEQTMNRAESAVYVERGIHNTTYDPPAPATQVFADLALDSWAAKWVEALWVDRYTAGCGTNPLIYCPWQGHTRAEGCVFYLRMLNGAAYEPAQPTQQTFADVPLETWYANWVQAAYDAGLLTACQTTPELRFCPNDPLTRALAAYMMVQAKGLR